MQPVLLLGPTLFSRWIEMHSFFFPCKCQIRQSLKKRNYTENLCAHKTQPQIISNKYCLIVWRCRLKQYSNIPLVLILYRWYFSCNSICVSAAMCLCFILQDFISLKMCTNQSIALARIAIGFSSSFCFSHYDYSNKRPNSIIDL